MFVSMNEPTNYSKKVREDKRIRKVEELLESTDSTTTSGKPTSGGLGNIIDVYA